MFALVIGIDDYASSDIPSLKGAVADARAFKAYLSEALGTPDDQIVALQNMSATRAALLGELQRLTVDPRIKTGDPIVIFYAGYGSHAHIVANGSSQGADTRIPVILPSDVLCTSNGKIVAPIPDCTLNALLEDISRKKGNNVTFIFDSCYSVADGKPISSMAVSEFERTIALPLNLYFQGDVDEVVRPSFHRLPSYVLLSACGASGQAWERNGGGAFTIALLDLLRRMPINKLRASDAVMLLDIDPRLPMSPYCVGRNQDKFLLTLTPPTSAFTFFVPVRARLERNGPVEYILSGGGAHGLTKGDQFDIYPDLESPQHDGTLAIVRLGTYYSVLQPIDKVIPITRNSIALRSQGGIRASLRVYSRPEDEASKILSALQVESQELREIVLVGSLDDAHLVISMQQDGLVIIELQKLMEVKVSFRVETTVRELRPVLQAASRFFFELDLASENTSLTDHVQIQIYKLPALPSARELLPLDAIQSGNGLMELERGSRYGLKITNQSTYGLYPVVHLFLLNREFQCETLYHPGYSQSALEAPLQAGRALAVDCDCEGSCSPCTGDEFFGFLKVSLFTRPLSPLYDAPSLRVARYLPEDFKGPWATIHKPLVYRTVTSAHDSLRRQESYPGRCDDFRIPLLNSEFLRRDYKEQDDNKSLDAGKSDAKMNVGSSSLPHSTADSPSSLPRRIRSRFHISGQSSPKLIWTRIRKALPRLCRSSNYLS